jgi:3-oxoacyl-[acyl-carrier-protein] synthase-1
MGDGAAFNYIAMQQAIIDAGLEGNEVSNVRTGLIMGSGGESSTIAHKALDFTIDKIV